MALGPRIRSLAAKKAREAARAAERRALAVKPAPKPLAARPTPRPALPAPPKVLALPPPDPAKQLPPFAAKPRGGQWMVRGKGSEYDFGDFSPDVVARETIPGGLLFSSDPNDHALRDWYKRALTKYVMNDMGTPEDPIRSLAERGLAHKPDLTPDKWSDLASGTIIGNEPIGSYLLPPNTSGGMPGAGSTLRSDTMQLMPWLAKAPVTDPLYRVNPGGIGALEFGHVADELRQAMKADAYGIPPDLAVRPESLARMSFPQAVERVGRINQFRAKKMEEESLAALNNPAIQTFKEYPDMGYRWVELRQPEGVELPQDFDILGSNDLGYDVMGPDGTHYGYSKSRDEAIAAAQQEYARRPLQDALKYEGDTMGHCVGGYCDDVASGRSRIFSLRDAKGQPHVTIETAPRDPYNTPQGFGNRMNELRPGVWDEIIAHPDFSQLGGHGTVEAHFPDLWAQIAGRAEDIIQIKGKQNRAPNDDYLPYVQDFVKSGTWGNIGDLGNTGLVKLPDGRYITKQQYEEGATKWLGQGASDLLSNQRMYGDDFWERNDWKPHFEGYAVGGRIERNRCFSRHPMSVR